VFRESDQQSNLLAANFLLKPAKRQRLERSWAAQFRDIVLPLIEEEHFRDCFHVDNGRPNFPIRTLVGLQLLKEMSDRTEVPDTSLPWTEVPDTSLRRATASGS
jgi:hypothetical protein